MTRTLGTRPEAAPAVAAAIAALPTSPLAALNAYRHTAFGGDPLPAKRTMHADTWGPWHNQTDLENLRMDARFLLRDVMGTDTLPHAMLGDAVGAALYGLTTPGSRPAWAGPVVPTTPHQWALELVMRTCDLLRHAFGDDSAARLVDEMTDALIGADDTVVQR
jgi:hypothetical protein